MQIIQERIHALRDMLEELFTYTKLESRSYEVPLTKCDFGALVKEALFSYYNEWQKQQMEPQLQLEEGALWAVSYTHLDVYKRQNTKTAFAHLITSVFWLTKPPLKG